MSSTQRTDQTMMTDIPQPKDFDEDINERKENTDVAVNNNSANNNEWEALPDGLDPITELEEEEFKQTAYANNAFAINEEKQHNQLRDSIVTETTCDDMQSTDIESILQ